MEVYSPTVDYTRIIYRHSVFTRRLEVLGVLKLIQKIFSQVHNGCQSKMHISFQVCYLLHSNCIEVTQISLVFCYQDL